MLKNDPLSRVLFIDLSEKRFWIEERIDLFEKYLGGTGVAIQLLDEECPRGIDPFDPENPIILAVGPLNGLFPLASKTVAMFKSPHTGNLGESHSGGRSGVALRMAGYGAIVIKGKSEIPVYIAVHGDKVYFRDARALWGMYSSFTVGRIIREREPRTGLRTIMRIGRAGERLVTYAGVITETYRHFGRLGLGAVFGSKKLKALVISGKRSLPTSNSKLYRDVYDEIYKAAVDSPVMKKYHDFGTLENIIPLNMIKALPTRNLRQPEFEGASQISGETFAQNYLGRRLACSHCPIGCVHIAALREPYEDIPYFYKTSMISYDYEPIYALGAMLGGSDIPSILKLIEQVEVLGLDVISTGVILAWATEAFERGSISEKDTYGIKLEWGNYLNYVEAVRLMVEQPNEYYKALARGVQFAASKYGGQDFALSFGGNEMPGYHTGPATYISYLVGARHSHLDSAGYGLDQKMLTSQKKPTPEETAESLLLEERWRQILSSLVVCFFARGIYKADEVIKCLEVVGFDLTKENLTQLGAEVLKKKHEFKLREGFSPEDLKIPKRIFETPSSLGEIREDFLQRTVKHFIAKIKE